MSRLNRIGAFLGAMLLALIVVVAANAAPSYRTPPTATTYWIWPTLNEAKHWSDTHVERLCIVEVPDGFATYGCTEECEPHFFDTLDAARAFEALHPNRHFDVIWDGTNFHTECIG